MCRKKTLAHLWQWARIVKIWVRVGGNDADLPIGTTNVEGGFFGMREDAFVSRQRGMSRIFFERGSAASCMNTNFWKSWKGALPPLAQSRAQRMDLLMTCDALLRCGSAGTNAVAESSLGAYFKRRLEPIDGDRANPFRKRKKRRAREQRQLPWFE